MNDIEKYYSKIISGEAVVSEKVNRVYKHLCGLINDKGSEWEFNQRKAEHAISFIEQYCRHSKGASGGKKFILELWQRAMVSALFGFVHSVDGTRKFRELMLLVGRKNGKSMIGSAIALYMLMADGESGPEVASIATKKDQSKIIWLEAKRMVKKSPALGARAKCLVGEIVTEFNDGSFRALSSDSNTLDGLNLHACFADEVHAWTDKNLYDVTIDSMTAREQPLYIITTTAGTVREGIFDIKYDEAAAIINRMGDQELSPEEERLLPIIYELDSRKEWTDPKCWKKANPGLGTIKDLDQLTDKVAKAQKNPLLVKNLLCKDFNIRETVSEAWLTFEQLNNPATYDLKSLGAKYGIGGADLSSTTDLTCATVLFMVPGDETIYCLQMYFLPEDLLETREKDDKIPYSTWRDMGLLRTTPGNRVHYAFVTQWFEEVMSIHDIYLFRCGYDSWSAKYWVEDMVGKFGKSVMDKQEVIQGKKTLSGPMKNLGADLEAKRINYNNNPILKWCLSNTAITIDTNQNIQPDKSRNQRRRIDGTASLMDAYVCLERCREEYLAMI